MTIRHRTASKEITLMIHRIRFIQMAPLVEERLLILSLEALKTPHVKNTKYLQTLECTPQQTASPSSSYFVSLYYNNFI